VSLIRVLVVDDDPSARQTAQAHLDRPGFQVVSVDSGLEALRVMAEEEIDVVLLDAMMPGIDGFETCRRIKANPDWEGTPIVMATALDTQQDRNAGLRAGADDFLTKPINGTELRLRLTAHSKVKAYHSLLANVLPPSIARRLRTEPGFVADRVDCGTILFSDLVGFVPFARSRPAAEVVGVLDHIFRAFDRCCESHCLEKIKTIGDAYMLAGGLHKDDAPEDAAIRVVSAGLEFFQLLEQVNTDHGLSLQLRMGVHSGPLIAGVIGQSRLSYDLWGDTVNLASRMESHGVPGRLQLSDSTRELIGDRFPLEDMGIRDIKGRGVMQTWMVRESS
jgi:class 3 adenylate cyclase